MSIDQLKDPEIDTLTRRPARYMAHETALRHVHGTADAPHQFHPDAATVDGDWLCDVCGNLYRLTGGVIVADPC